MVSNNEKINAIIDHVCYLNSITKEQVKSKRRDRKYLKGRYQLYYVLYHYIGLTLKEAGSILGGRDHSSINNGMTKLEYMKDFEKEIKDLKRWLNNYGKDDYPYLVQYIF